MVDRTEDSTLLKEIAFLPFNIYANVLLNMQQTSKLRFTYFVVNLCSFFLSILPTIFLICVTLNFTHLYLFMVIWLLVPFYYRTFARGDPNDCDVKFNCCLCIVTVVGCFIKQNLKVYAYFMDELIVNAK